MKIVRVSPAELLDVLRRLPRCSPVGLVARTRPDLLRKGNPFHLGDGVFDVVRVRSCNGWIGYGYESIVNRQRAREGKPCDFRAAPRSWGERPPVVPGGNRRRRTCLVRHRGRWYLSLKRQWSVSVAHVRLDGTPIPDDALAPFLPRRTADRRQNLDRPVEVRDYGLTSIAQLTLSQVRYVVTPCPHTAPPRCTSRTRSNSSSRGTASSRRT